MNWFMKLFSFLIVVQLNACAGQPTNTQATLTWHQRASAALGKTMLRPSTWVPLLGAGICALGNSDRKISDYAREQQYIFGSTRRAEQYSDGLVAGLVATALVTSMLPDRSQPIHSGKNAAYRLMNEAIGFGIANGISGSLKYSVARERPNEFNQYSFPSGHSMNAMLGARFASFNLELYTLGDRNQRWATSSLHTLAVATAWSRVEAGWHYPSDVLAGIALGNIVSNWTNDMSKHVIQAYTFSSSSSERSLMLNWHFLFN